MAQGIIAMRVLHLLGVAGFAVTLSGPALATTYNAVTDFSATNNPTGVWSYRQGDGTLLTGTATISAGSLPYWGNNSSYPNGTYVVDNNTATNYQNGTVYYRANDITIDGQSVGATVRFIAPTAGSYTVNGEFQANDVSTHPHTVQIMLNGATSEFSATTPASYTAPGDTFSFVVSLAASNFLDFSTVFSGDATYQSTGLAATVTGPAGPAGVPEPGSLALLGAGLLGLIGTQALRKHPPRSACPGIPEERVVLSLA